ncbi:CHAT domain-containing protein [Aquimarina algicola]|uniref:Tetratricopeptide repeat protein n=1 Tax=Aquimarina algicola TaxID=2589995 RepID=A0A504IYB0_9FLAO|nr:CHAT domain-containing protein [Aquimarina algicola]TPN83044.1 tetratricopeptide repeat protein [Aquimarina algicola]
MQPTTPTFCTKIVSVLLFMFLCCSIYAQKKDTLVASRHFIKAQHLLTAWKLDSAIVYFEKALPIYQNANAQKKVATTYEKIAETQRKNYDLDIALENAKKALAIKQQLFEDKHPEIALSYNSIGHILKKQDKFQKAMEFYQKALSIQLKHFGENDYRVADCYHNMGTIDHILARYDQAMNHYQKALQTRVQTFGNHHQKIAESYIDIGTTYYHIGKYKSALEYYQNALKIRKKIYPEKSIEVAFCYHHIGNILTRTNKYKKALQHQEKAISIIANTLGEQHPNLAFCYKNIGVIYKLKGNHDKALRYFNKALKVLNKKSERLFSSIYNEIGIINLKKGWYNKSLQYFEKALIISKKILGKHHSRISARYNNIGLVYQHQGKYNKAISYYNKANEIYIEILGKNHTAVARVYNNIANCYKAKKEYTLADYFYKKALQIRINKYGENHHETSYTYHDLAGICIVKKEYDTALSFYKKALKIHKHFFGNTNYNVSDINNAIAHVYRLKKEYHNALEILLKSIEVRLLTDGKHHPRTAKSYNLIAKTYHQKKDYKNALLYYDKAITANTKSQENLTHHNVDFGQYLDLNILLQTYQGKAKVLRDQHQENHNLTSLEESIKIYHKTDTLIKSIRQTLQNYQDKITFADLTQKVYEGAIQAQLQYYNVTQNQEALEQAFLYSEKSKANALKGLLAASNAKSFIGLPTTIQNAEKNLKTDYAFYTSEITNEWNMQHPDSTKIVAYENQLFNIGRKLDSLTQHIAKKYPKYYQLQHKNDSISIADIQKNLDTHTTIVEFFTSDSTTYVFTVSKNSIKATTLATPKLEENIKKLRKSIITQETFAFKTLSHQIYKQIISPIKKQLTGDQIIIIPDGPLWHLNFELLLTENDASNNPRNLSYLLKTHAIGYASSAKLLFTTRPKKDKLSKNRQECLAFSFSDSLYKVNSETISLATLRDTHADLPGTREEIKAISEIIEGQYYYGNQAIETNFKEHASQYNILHLALHGEIDNERPENSRLLFTKNQDAIEDNYLYSHELFALNIPAELAVLSACNTGDGKIAKGEGIMSIGNAFQYAGTKSLLLTSWEVSDQTTPELMKYFYINLKKGMNKIKALQQAKLQYLTHADINRTDPFYWGGFYLIGNTSAIEFNSNTNSYYWIVFILSLLVISSVGIFVYRKRVKK